MRPQKIIRTMVKDASPGLERFRAEVMHGLRKPQKELPSKYFYDDRGSYLFELICTLDEYYIPRTETAIMADCIEEITELIGPGAFLLEYGSGSCQKVRLLLDNLDNPTAYTPIDISGQQLLQVSQELSADYPQLEVLPVCTDYTGNFELPVPGGYCARTVVYFPGSTISNFDPVPAIQFLEHVAGVCGEGGGLLIGVDLKKDPAILHRAYNDSKGVTAAFNLNLLERINRELGADFELDAFEHYAFYNPGESRIEMHLVSLREQEVHLGETTIPFHMGESIWTESSYKFSLDDFEQMAARAGFRVKQVWTDPQNWFSVHYLENSLLER
ncbi:MAG: L-histidine N(alpha)-methyltransferase [Chloroflexi bacterium]|nr:L-histidine N(alpha)-methyltransferase [Chloroflexota bacterium]MBI3931673.1 L-histidine N(alpha)-methyltransferase [Chloroflexota bacterium]